MLLVSFPFPFPLLSAFRCSVPFRFRFRPDTTGHDTRQQGSHTKPNRPTGACWFRFGEAGTRGEGRGAIPPSLSNSSGGGLLFNVPDSFIHSSWGAFLSVPPWYHLVPLSAHLVPLVVSLPACLQQRVPCVVSGTFLCLEFVT